MNFALSYLPSRDSKPRQSGITMMMDKGLSLRETEDFCEAAGEFTDIVKFGFGTSLICSKLHEKIKIYRDHDIRVYFGGTLFELFIVRQNFDDFRRFIDMCKLDTIEISDGSMNIPHNEKLNYIRLLAKDFTVLSEVGYKVSGISISNEKWIEMMNAELNAGAWKVIAEARENGTNGIYNTDGSADSMLICDILNAVNKDNILWEAPLKTQQTFFIKLLGANVNLGNISSHEIISLETLRLGLRGDTFFDFLPDELLNSKLK